MVQQLKDDLLHKRTKHTNYSGPVPGYITADSFPSQDNSILGTVRLLKYRDMNVQDRSNLSKCELADPHDVYEDEFMIVRCDNTEPFVTIGIREKDAMVIWVGDSRKMDTYVDMYPLQLDQYIGIKVLDQYYTQPTGIEAVTFRVDDGEPCNTVLCEVTDNTGKIRFVLGDECMSKIPEGTKFEYKSREEIADIIMNTLGGKSLV